MPTTSASLKALVPLLGTWNTEATHPAFRDLIVRGKVRVEWLEGEQFLIHRARNDHPEFPDSISILGFTDRDRVSDAGESKPASAGNARMSMHYFDSRGVARVYHVEADADALRFERMAPGLSQRFTGTYADGGDTMIGLWQMCEDGERWVDDLRITYRRSR